MTLELQVRRVLADLGFLRKFDPNQPRDPDGKWGDGTGALADLVKPKADKLKLDGKIKLAPGERLVASAKAKQSDMADTAVLLAAISTPAGPQIRLGIDPGDAEGGNLGDGDDLEDLDGEGWSGNNPDTTIRLDQAGIDRMHDVFARENAAAKTRQKEMLADWERMDELQGDSSPAAQAELAGLTAKHAGPVDGTIGQGVIAGIPGGGHLAYQVRGEDDGEGGWEFLLAVKPADASPGWDFDEATEGGYVAGLMSPKQLAAFQRQIASMAERAGEARSVRSGGRFDKNQPRDPDGKFGHGAGVDLDLPDLGDDDEVEADSGFGDEDPYDNGSLPAAYREKYGDVVEQVDVGGGTDLYIAKTDKGGFHIAKGVEDRQVLTELDDEAAGSIAEFAALYAENQPSFHITVPGTDVTMHSAGDGGVRLDWADGSSSTLTSDDVDYLVDGLVSMTPGLEGDDGG